MLNLTSHEKPIYPHVFGNFSQFSQASKQTKVVLAHTITQKIRIECDYALVKLFMSKIKQVEHIHGNEEFGEVQFYVLLRMCAINQHTLRQDIEPREVIQFAKPYVCAFDSSELEETQLDSLAPQQLNTPLVTQIKPCAFSQPQLKQQSSSYSEDELEQTQISNS